MTQYPGVFQVGHSEISVKQWPYLLHVLFYRPVFAHAGHTPGYYFNSGLYKRIYGNTPPDISRTLIQVLPLPTTLKDLFHQSTVSLFSL